MNSTDDGRPVAVGSSEGLGPAGMTHPPLGTHESARDIVQTIALAMKRGYKPEEILAEDSPIVERIWAEATTVRPDHPWRPVDTAPPDVVLLLYSPWRHDTNPERIETGVFRNTRSGSEHAWATHWMPLPAGPNVRGNGLAPARSNE